MTNIREHLLTLAAMGEAEAYEMLAALVRYLDKQTLIQFALSENYAKAKDV